MLILADDEIIPLIKEITYDAALRRLKATYARGGLLQEAFFRVGPRRTSPAATDVTPEEAADLAAKVQEATSFAGSYVQRTDDGRGRVRFRRIDLDDTVETAVPPEILDMAAADDTAKRIIPPEIIRLAKTG